MQQNRLNITREKSPTLVLLNSTLKIALEVGDVKQLEVELEIEAQDINPDENDNETMKHKLVVLSMKEIIIKGNRR